MEHHNPLLQNKSSHKFITIGEIMLRLTPPNYQKIRMANEFEATYGGSEANIALSLANLGIDSTFFSVVPNNSIGKSAVRMLRSNDVHCTPVILSTPEETPTHRLGTYYLETGYGIRSSKVTYDRKHSAITEYDLSKALKQVADTDCSDQNCQGCCRAQRLVSKTLDHDAQHGADEHRQQNADDSGGNGGGQGVVAQGGGHGIHLLLGQHQGQRTGLDLRGDLSGFLLRVGADDGGQTHFLGALDGLGQDLKGQGLFHMVQHNAFSTGSHQAFGQNVSQTTTHGDGVHMGSEYVDTLGVFLYPADIHNGAGEDDVNAVLFSYCEIW